MIRSITYVASTRRLGTFHITGAAPLSFERAWLWTSWSCFASWDSHNYFIAEDIHGARKWNCIILKIAIPQSGRSEFDNLFVYFAFHAHGPTWMLEGCFCSTSSMFVCMLRSLVQILTALEFILQDFQNQVRIVGAQNPSNAESARWATGQNVLATEASWAKVALAPVTFYLSNNQVCSSNLTNASVRELFPRRYARIRNLAGFVDIFCRWYWQLRGCKDSDAVTLIPCRQTICPSVSPCCGGRLFQRSQHPGERQGHWTIAVPTACHGLIVVNWNRLRHRVIHSPSSSNGWALDCPRLGFPMLRAIRFAAPTLQYTQQLSTATLPPET